MIVAMITRFKHLLFLVPDDYSPKLLLLVVAFFSVGWLTLILSQMKQTDMVGSR
mgnify:CR=1 FL=1